MTGTSLATREPLLLGTPVPVLAAGAAVLALVTAAAEVVLSRGEVVSWPLEIAALVVLASAGALVVARANPFRSPFRARWHVAVLGLVLTAFALDEAAQAGRDLLLHDDWGLATVPVFLLVLAILRPPREVLAGGLAVTAVVAVVVLLSSGAAPMPPLERVAIAVTQILPPAIAAAALARTTMQRLGSRVPAPAVPVPDAALPVRQEAVAQLEAAAIPLLSAVAAAGEVTEEQASRAREIAAELRGVLVAGLARGWLVEAGFAVDDPDDYAERLAPEQRTALRTAVASLPLADFERPGSASVTGQDRSASLVLVLPVSARPRRSRVAPLVPLLRAAFPRADIRIDDDRVTVLVDLVVER